MAKSSDVQLRLNRPIKIGIYVEYESAPIFRFYRHALESALGDKVQFIIYDKPNLKRMVSAEVDAYIRILGISPGDPLTHFAFVQEATPLIREALPRSRIEELSKIESIDEFNREVLALEHLILRERLMVPLAHFPGIVAYSKNFIRDENLAWSWGIQPWTYRVR